MGHGLPVNSLILVTVGMYLNILLSCHIIVFHYRLCSTYSLSLSSLSLLPMAMYVLGSPPPVGCKGLWGKVEANWSKLGSELWEGVVVLKGQYIRLSYNNRKYFTLGGCLVLKSQYIK